MIKNQWYVVLKSNEVKSNKPVGVIRFGEKLVFWRDSNGEVTCMFDRCPHLGAKLSMGKINKDNITCPFHGFEYDQSGKCDHIPAFGNNGKIPRSLKVKTYPTYELNDFIWVYYGEDKSEETQPPKFFSEISNEFSYLSFCDHWKVHYSRMIENQLDMSHLPFVHHNTIGRGNKSVVDGPLVIQDGQQLNVWVHNREDNGTKRLSANELEIPDRHPSLQFHFPNIWHNWIADDIRVMIAFVPVDEENTLLYGRFYQKVIKVPIIKSIMNISGVIGSKVIANQDKRVVEKQTPVKSSYISNDMVMPSDHAIKVYRKVRKQLKEDAGQI